ncbi:hypothetical protein [Paenibacillus sp. FSL H7-0331]|uniref:hypothetical protein n=1 Tax=Paenibacillus sp. FSL H7-0331 TaxID=1920421 RepID=UPI00096C118F|nr:hypothetical protein [Paenibacillus sp. FSL H7-0331]OMF14158.1 hypothetical protein BK127_19730 [Paenibacillus sp. FSL H7-0331]
MVQVFVFLHVLAAIMMGIYLLLPFLSMRIQALTGQAQFGFLSVLFAVNRTGQMALVIALLSGGYLVSKVGNSVAWMIVSVVLFLALGALTGVLGGAMRKALSDPSGSKVKDHLGKIKSMSVICGILFFLIVGVMKFPF